MPAFATPVFATFISDFHESFSFFVVIGNGLAGLWALLGHWIQGVRYRALWWFTAVAQISIGVQILIGVGVIAAEDVEVDGFHLFYGFIALASAGIIYSYRSQLAARKYLLYGLGGIFLMGLGIRAMLIGGGTGT